MSEVQNAWWFIWNSLCCSILEPITHTDVAQGAYFTATRSVLVKRREAVGRRKETTGRGWVLKASVWMVCVCWVGTVEGHVGTESGKGYLVARESRRWASSENRKYPSCWQLQGTVWGPLRLGRTLWARDKVMDVEIKSMHLRKWLLISGGPSIPHSPGRKSNNIPIGRSDLH